MAVAGFVVASVCNAGLLQAGASGGVDILDHATHTIEFNTQQVTRSYVDVSRDGRTIVFDALGDLYTVPMAGGEAVALTSGRAWDAMPRYSPDGKRIALMSDRGGSLNLWTIAADGSDPVQITTGDDSPMRAPVWTPEGKPVFGEAQKVTAGEGVTARISPDGNWMASLRGGPNDYALHIHKIATGQGRVLIDGITGIHEFGINKADPAPTFAFTPDSRSIVLSRSGRLTRVDIRTGVSQVIPLRLHIVREVGVPVHRPRRIETGGELRTKIVRWPSLDPKGNQVISSVLGKLYATDLKTDRSRRLTTSDDLEYAPALSRDGRWVAYTTQSDGGAGHVMIVSAKGGTGRPITREAGRYANPAWSPNGSQVAFVVASKSIRPSSLGAGTSVWIASVGGGTPPRKLAAVPTMIFPTRYYPVPTFGPDGQRLYVATALIERFQNVVSSFDLRNGERIDHLEFPFVDEAVIAPDGRRVALVWQDALYVATLQAQPSSNAIPRFDTSAAIRVTDDAPAQIAWQDSQTLTWAVTSQIYRQRLGETAAHRVVDIDIRRPRSYARGRFAIANARLITMRGAEVIERGTLVVSDGRIAAVGPSEHIRIPRGIPVVDAKGKSLLPGLIDVHWHSSGSGRDIWVRRGEMDITALAYGITALYDPGFDVVDIVGTQELAEAGELLAPRKYSSGNVILAMGQRGISNLCEIHSLEDARRAVQFRARHATGPLKEYNYPRREQRQWLIRAARELGVPMTNEGIGFAKILTTIADGYTAVEHVLPAMEVYDDVAQFIARSKVHYTPTLITAQQSDGYLYFGRRADLEHDARYLRFAPSEWIVDFRDLMQGMAADNIPPADKEARLLRYAQATAKVAAQGGLVSAGSHTVLPGLDLHWELWAFVLGGMPEYEALRAATLTAAQKLDLDADLGSLEPGKLADFVILDGNPLKNIRDSVTVRAVVLNGFVYDAPSMTRIWPTRRPLGVLPQMSQEQRTQHKAPAPPQFPSLSQ